VANCVARTAVDRRLTATEVNGPEVNVVNFVVGTDSEQETVVADNDSEQETGSTAVAEELVTELSAVSVVAAEADGSAAEAEGASTATASSTGVTLATSSLDTTAVTSRTQKQPYCFNGSLPNDVRLTFSDVTSN